MTFKKDGDAFGFAFGCIWNNDLELFEKY